MNRNPGWRFSLGTEEHVMEIQRTKPVLVTGGNGYVASWLVRDLLDAGFTVHATVRNPDDERRVGHLRRIAQATKGYLRLFRADLLEGGTFDEAMQGCELVYHTASPFSLAIVSSPQERFVRPALEGTRNVLLSVERQPQVRRVVLTSSIAAIYGDNIDVREAPGQIADEQCWNSTSSLEHEPYYYSKTLAERFAWGVARAQSRWDLVVLNPALTLGPSLTLATESGSMEFIGRYTDGSLRLGAPDFTFPMVDVRDVAAAHLGAGFTSSASGRHLLASDAVSVLRLGQILSSRFGSGYPFPRSVAPKALLWLIAPLLGITRKFVERNVGISVRVDNSYARRDLGVAFRPIEETIIDQFQQLIDDGLVPLPNRSRCVPPAGGCRAPSWRRSG